MAVVPVAVLGLSVMPAAHAQSTSSSYMPSFSVNNLYVGGSLNSQDWHGAPGGVDARGSGVGYSLYGGYQFTPNFALEAGGTDLGNFDGPDGSASMKAGYLDAVGTLPLKNDFSLIGRIGYVGGNLRTSNGIDHADGVKLGVGAQYDLNSHVALRGEIARYRLDAFDDHNSIDQLSLGVKVGF